LNGSAHGIPFASSPWHSLGVTESILGDDGAIQQVKAHISTDGKANRFVHLKVTGP